MYTCGRRNRCLLPFPFVSSAIASSLSQRFLKSAVRLVRYITFYNVLFLGEKHWGSKAAERSLPGRERTGHGAPRDSRTPRGIISVLPPLGEYVVSRRYLAALLVWRTSFFAPCRQNVGVSLLTSDQLPLVGCHFPVGTCSAHRHGTRSLARAGSSASSRPDSGPQRSWQDVNGPRMQQACPLEPGNAFIYGRSPRSPSFGPFPQEGQLRIELLPREPTGSARPI